MVPIADITTQRLDHRSKRLPLGYRRRPLSGQAPCLLAAAKPSIASAVLHSSDRVRHIRTEMLIHFAAFQIGGLSGGIQLPRGVVLRLPHPERTWARKAPRTSSSPLLPLFRCLARLVLQLIRPCRSVQGLRGTTDKQAYR
jgi:hypothetical protein